MNALVKALDQLEAELDRSSSEALPPVITAALGNLARLGVSSLVVRRTLAMAIGYRHSAPIMEAYEHVQRQHAPSG